jgi:asparagine synthase (glutamine-hydrolysing)
LCGIGGILSLNNGPINNVRRRSLLMMSMLKNRGPDYNGYWIEDNNRVSIVNTRLSIVDIDNKFEVPFISNSKNAIMAYNGEIYNYKYLYDYLISKGLSLKFKSDTEIMLEGIERYGIDFFKLIDGFWSLGLFNKKENKFLLSRDLMGEKGLYYSVTKDELIFCSEIDPIIAISKNSCELDYNALISSFKFRSAPPSGTIIKGISKLSPGHSIECDLNTGKINKIVTQKFSLEPWIDFFNSDPSESKVLDIYEEQLYEAIKSRIPNEVEFYATLSGGIDSTLISIYASKFAKLNINTVYAHSSNKAPKKGQDLDEFQASLYTSKKLNTNHESFSMISEKGFENYKKLSENCFDGVFCEGIPSFASIAEYIKEKNSKVLLLSDGPDEFLGGYDVDKNLYEDMLNNNKKNYEIDISSKRKENLKYFQSKPFYFRPIHGGTSAQTLKYIFNDDALDKFTSQYGSIGSYYEDIYDEIDISQKIALSYALYTLPDYFNARTDRATMYHSVEARLPFQTPSLVNLMIGTPGKWRFKNRTSKYILRKIVERHLGKDIAFRNKYGFAYPIWQNKAYNTKLNMGDAIFNSEIFQSPYFNKNVLNFLNEEIKSNNQRHIWMAYSATKTYKNLKNLNKKKLMDKNIS